LGGKFAAPDANKQAKAGMPGATVTRLRSTTARQASDMWRVMSDEPPKTITAYDSIETIFLNGNALQRASLLSTD
jgi:hypothetical protein